ncbi:UDP-GlcNAc:betaGal beta-1,3-N-acetylglucosaminyltransferase 9 [Macrotis lagotis]|uniref:UDP-GlcNAc:betaGal beta-1,3-N-acetylglucosaminyltransferase 9 n=1 Tax=Macrotis lagotis TaxID=92651 RepID=UPI003D68CD3F
MRLRRKADAARAVLLAAALGALLYWQWEPPAAPASPRAPAAPASARAPASASAPVASARAPAASARAFPGAGPAPAAYDADTPPPPTPPGPFDFRRYLRDKDRRRFPLLIDQPHKCRGLAGGPGPDLLLAVKSAAAAWERREVVRKTWGAEGAVRGARVRRVFLLGLPGPGARAQAQEALLRAEARAYGDILLWGFRDTFFNLTLKELHFLAWAAASCPDARFVFQGDDDVFVHVENLLEFVAARDPARDLLAGDVILRARPIRARGSKYYIPEGVYGLGAYPAYAGGGGFVLSGATLRRLAAACAQVELFPIDDVFLGMCLQRLRLAPEAHQAFRTFGLAPPSAAPHMRTFDPCLFRELVLVHGLSAADVWLMWQLLHAAPGPACSRGRAAPGPFRWGA